MTYFLHRFSAPLRLSTPFMYIKEESVGFISAILRFWVLIGNIPELAETTSPWYCPGPHSQACRTLSRSWRRGRKTVTGSEGLELCVPASSWHPPEPAQGHCKAGLLSCLRGAAPALSPSWALARAPGRRQERHPQDVCRPSAAQPGLVIPPCFLHLVLEACVQEGRYVSPQTLSVRECGAFRASLSVTDWSSEAGAGRVGAGSRPLPLLPVAASALPHPAGHCRLGLGFEGSFHHCPLPRVLSPFLPARCCDHALGVALIT